MSLPKYPQTPVAQALCIIGAILLLLALAMQSRMWLAVFGWQPVAPGGGEYMVALFIGLPLLLSTLMLVVATASRTWRCKISAMLLVPALTVLAGWVALFLRSLFV
ncbi:MAG: hypothetical protein FJY44_10985 [Betaproteobacteria bacterium]|nr:hypothetical protein [Betaproteobacteria bacterium]